MLQPTPVQEPVVDVGFFEQGQAPKARGSRCHRCRGGMGSEEGLPLPRNFKILGLEIAYYGAF